MANMFDDIDPAMPDPVAAGDGNESAAPKKKSTMFDDMPDAAQEQSSATSSFLSHAASGLLPAAGGIVAASAGAEAGGIAGAGLGSFFGPVGTAAGGVIGAIGGGLAGFWGGAKVTEGAQDWAIHQAPDNWQDALGQSDRDKQLQEQQHPYASLLGGLAPYALTLNPSLAFRGASALPENATSFQKLMSYSATQKIFGGAFMGGQELASEEINGETPDWAKIGISTGFGLVFTKPTRLGQALHAIGSAPFHPNGEPIPPGQPGNPTVAQAADVGVMGPGITESTFHGGEEQSTLTKQAAQNNAADESLLLNGPPQPDLHGIARRLDPETFQTNDELIARRDSLRQFIDQQSNPPSEAFDALASKQSEIEAALEAANPRSPDARNYRAQLADIEAQRQDLSTRQEAWANGTHVDTPEIMLARQHLMDTEHELWDLGPKISAAMRRAADHAGQFEEEPAALAEQPAGQAPEQAAAPAVGEQPSEPGQPAAEAPKSPEAQRASIVADRSSQLMAAGMPREQAEANAHVEAAYYETLAARFGGKLGTAEDLYRERAAKVVGPRGQTSTPPATPTAPVASPRPAPPEAPAPAVAEPSPTGPTPRPRLRTAEQIARDEGMPATKANGRRIEEIQNRELIALSDWQARQREATGPKQPEAQLLPTPEQPIAPQHTEASGNGGLEAIDPRDINVDADRFQFKSGGDEAGVTDRLQGVQKWDPRLAGTALVFRDADGKNWIADGHQRHGLATRLANEGQEDIKMNAFVLDAKDGITDADARAIAAAKNIAEGSGTAIDAAKIMRQAADSGIELPAMPPRSALVRDGRSLARLSPDAFGMAINDVVPIGQASIVGRLISDHAMQTEAMRVLAKAKPENLRQAEMIVREVLETGTEDATAQGGLFGDEHFASSAVLERAKVADEAMRQLSRDRTTFKTLVGEAERIQAHGANTLDFEANKGRLTADEQAKQLLTTLATTKGPVSDALTGIARRLKSGEISAAAGAREFLGVIREHVAGELGEGADAGGAVHGAAGERELAQEPSTDLLGRPIAERTEAAPEPTIRNDPNQAVMPGMEESAVQAQAARDQAGRGGLEPTTPQKAADEGLFAPPKDDNQRELLQGAQGKIRLGPDGDAVIHLLRTADASTFMHETAHHWLEQMMGDATHEAAPDDLRADADTVRRWLGLKPDADRIPTAKHEKFARGFEQYLREGVAPSKQLASVFAQFKTWLTGIYQTLKGLGAPISEDIRGVFDRMLANSPERTVYVPEKAAAEGIAAVHLADAAKTSPEHAGTVGDRMAAERTRFITEQPPEIVSELTEASAAITERAAGEASERAGEDGNGTAAGGPLDAGGGQSEPVTPGGRGGAPGGDVGKGRGQLTPKGPELPLGSDNGPQSGSSPGVGQFAPKPATILTDAEPKLVDKAGNIRVENLTDVPDIAQAIHDSAERNDEFRAVRGGMTKGQMMDLAESMGLDPSSIDEAGLSRLFGGTTDLGAKILAARKLVIESAKGVSDAMKALKDSQSDGDAGALAAAISRHDMIQSALSGVTAEWGRAGSAFHSLMAGWQSAQDVNQFLKDNLGRDLFQLKQIAKLGSTLDTPGKVSKFLRDAQKRTWPDMVLEYWINGLISGPATHVTYGIGNTILGVNKAGPETAVAATIGAIRKSFGREGERVHIGEVGAQLKGAFREAPAAVQAAMEGLRSGQTTLLPGERAHAMTPFEGDSTVNYGRSMVERTTAYAHEFEQSIDRQARAAAAKETLDGSVDEKRVAELKKNPTPEMNAQAEIDGKSAASSVNPVTWQEAIGDAKANGYALAQGTLDGIQAWGRLLTAGGDRNAPWLSADYSHLGQIPNINIRGATLPVGDLARLPSRMVATMHSGFRAMNYSMEINALAYRQAAEEGLTGTALAARTADLRQNPTEAMMEGARTKATDMTLMSQGGAMTKAIQKLTQVRVGGFQLLKFIEPFVAIASNVMDQALVQRTPIGLLSSEVRADLMGKNGNVAQDMAGAKMLVGTALMTGFGALASQGLVNGSGPGDPHESAMWRLAGNQAHSIRIGDVWYDIHKLGPLGMVASVAADMYDVAHSIGKEDAAKVGSAALHAITQSILDESFMRGPAEAMRAATESDRYGAQWVKNFASSFLPYSVAMSQAARASDPYSRQARTIMDGIKAKIPGLSESLFPRRDIWGQPMPSGEALGHAGLTAIYATRMSHDPVNQAMLNLGIYPGPVGRTIRNTQLTDKQYDQFAEIAGKQTKMIMDQTVQSQTFQEWPKSVQHEVILSILKSSREAAVGRMLQLYPNLAIEGAKRNLARKTGDEYHYTPTDE